MGTDVKKMRKELKALSDKVNKSGGTTMIAQYAAYQRSGILPPPDELERYEILSPGITERLLKTYENQVAHRIKLEDIVIRGDSKRATLGQILSFIIVMVAFGISLYLILIGKSVQGFISMVMALGGLVGSFIASFSKRRDERKRKNMQH